MNVSRDYIPKTQFRSTAAVVLSDFLRVQIRFIITASRLLQATLVVIQRVCIRIGLRATVSVYPQFGLLLCTSTCSAVAPSREGDIEQTTLMR